VDDNAFKNKLNLDVFPITIGLIGTLIKETIRTCLQAEIKAFQPGIPLKRETLNRST